tara:strand:- start:1839 stop:3461 length:1623 start_codon:yes stop_codon:yes gene_type:complete
MVFKTPIDYCRNTTLSTDIINELQLHSEDDCGIFDKIYNRDNSKTGKRISKHISSKYVTDISFLKDMQSVIFGQSKLKMNPVMNIDGTLKIWEKFTQISFPDFCSCYPIFLQYDMLKHLNRNDLFLYLSNLYMLTSPIWTIISPLISVIIPYFILPLRGIKIDMTEYINVLKKSLYQMITNMTKNNSGVQSLVYVGVYLFSVYQNVNSVFRFYTNVKKMRTMINDIRILCQTSIDCISKLLRICPKKPKSTAFNKFINNITLEKEFIEDWIVRVKDIPDNTTIKSLFNNISTYKIFYEIYTESNDFIDNMFGLIGYYNVITSIREQLSTDIFKADIQKDNKIKITDARYPCQDTNPICFNVDASVITGENASGKTTTLKTLFINTILAQQFGGCFAKQFTLTPYHSFHCYLNIPDTNDRDSLFQAEVRRCKQILDDIQRGGSRKKHLCIFDELFSGTNPEDATKIGLNFIKYLETEYPNVHFLLTTHYIGIPNTLSTMDCKRIKMYKMDNYHPVPGIATTSSCEKILKDMGLPNKIIDNI